MAGEGFDPIGRLCFQARDGRYSLVVAYVFDLLRSVTIWPHALRLLWMRTGAVLDVIYRCMGVTSDPLCTGPLSRRCADVRAKLRSTDHAPARTTRPPSLPPRSIPLVPLVFLATPCPNTSLHPGRLSPRTRPEPYAAICHDTQPVCHYPPPGRGGHHRRRVRRPHQLRRACARDELMSAALGSGWPRQPGTPSRAWASS